MLRSFAGGLAGALHGDAWLPSAWLPSAGDRDHVVGIARELAEFDGAQALTKRALQMA